MGHEHASIPIYNKVSHLGWLTTKIVTKTLAIDNRDRDGPILAEVAQPIADTYFNNLDLILKCPDGT